MGSKDQESCQKPSENQQTLQSEEATESDQRTAVRETVVYRRTPRVSVLGARIASVSHLSDHAEATLIG